MSDYLEAQRKHFEAQFGSLESLGYSDKTKDIEKESEEEFAGFSESESDSSDGKSEGDEPSEPDSITKVLAASPQGPKVVKFTVSSASAPYEQSKQEKKLMKSGKAQSIDSIPQSTGKVDDSPDDIKKDIALQRLLEESHILASHGERHSGAELTMRTIDYDNPTGKSRVRALDSRFKNLASVNGAHNGMKPRLEKMPMSMRKGMIKSREGKVSKYEREAKEAGVVLSKVQKGKLRDLNAGRGSTSSVDRLGDGTKKGSSNKLRDRGLKINSIGRSTRNGLVLSQQEIDRVSNAGKKRRKR